MNTVKQVPRQWWDDLPKYARKRNEPGGLAVHRVLLYMLQAGRAVKRDELQRWLEQKARIPRESSGKTVDDALATLWDDGCVARSGDDWVLAP